MGIDELLDRQRVARNMGQTELDGIILGPAPTARQDAERRANYDPEFDEHCTVGRTDDVAPNMHCACWYDGDGCCRCKAPAITDEQRREQGMIE